MPAFGQVDQRLESKLVELYRLHKERSAKVDWSYHEFLPISRRLKLKDVRPDGSDDLARAGITPCTWVINQSLVAAHPTARLLRRRAGLVALTVRKSHLLPSAPGAIRSGG